MEMFLKYKYLCDMLLIFLLLNSIRAQIATKYLIHDYNEGNIYIAQNVNGDPYLAYPMNTCTQDGNNPQTGGSQYTKYQCSATGDVVYQCVWGSDETCNNNAPCTQNIASYYEQAFDLINNPINGYGGGLCDKTLPNIAASTGSNYMEIKYYTAFVDSPDFCPGTPYNATTYVGFDYKTTNKIATGICVKQNDNSYLLATCDVSGAEISRYGVGDSSCNVKLSTLVSYKHHCSFIRNPGGQNNTLRWFRRYNGCYIKGINTLTPTNDPTIEPTPAPTTNPTKAPTKSPIKTPTISPTTSEPSVSPTKYPSNGPTIPIPTGSPTMKPTKSPITRTPTRMLPTRTQSPSPAPTFSPIGDGDDELDSIKDKVQGLGYLEIGIIVAVVLCIFIACYCFCRNRQKKAAKLRKTHGMNKKQREHHLREKNKKRKLELMQRNQRNQRGNNHQFIRQKSPSSQDGNHQFTAV